MRKQKERREGSHTNFKELEEDKHHLFGNQTRFKKENESRKHVLGPRKFKPTV